MGSIDFKGLNELIKGYLANGDIAIKYTCLEKCQKFLFNDVGDIINYCHEIIEANTELSFNDWCNDILVLPNDGYFHEYVNDLGAYVLNGNCKIISNPSYRAIWLIYRYIDKLIDVEISEAKGIQPNNNIIRLEYILTSGTFEYAVCRIIYDYFNEHTPHNKTNCIKDYLLIGNYFGDYIKAIKAVSLYVALKNEMACIKQQAAIEGVELNGVENTPKKDLNGLISVPNSTNGITIPQEAQKGVKSSLNVLTERAQKYFTLAIEQGFMEQTPDGHYKWLFGANRGKVRLGYFLEKIYAPNKKERLPLKDLQNLFNIERLDSAIYMRNGVDEPQQWLAVIDRLFED